MQKKNDKEKNLEISHIKRENEKNNSGETFEKKGQMRK